MGPFYVDADKLDNSGDGLSWADAKKDLQNAVDLIDDVFTGTVYIYVNADATNDYEGSVSIENIRGVGKDAKLVIAAANPGATIEWNEPSYIGHTYSPLVPGSSGTWGIKQNDKPVTLKMNVQISNCGCVELNGFCFYGSILMAMQACEVTARYCRFEGPESFALGLGGGSFLKAENCYFLGNSHGVVSAMNAVVMLMGDTYVENPVKFGMWARIGGKILMMPWLGVAPLDFNTTEIKTTKVKKNFVGIKAEEGSTVKVWDGYYPEDAEIARLKFFNDYKTLPSSYVCVALESGSMLSGADQIEFVMKNAKDEEVEMPGGNQIVTAQNEGCLKIK